MRPEFEVAVRLEASVSPSEDRRKVAEAITNILGGARYDFSETAEGIRVESVDASCLERIHEQLRDRQVRGAARRRMLAGREGNRTTVMVNRQAASVGVLAMCDQEGESPLGPSYMTLEAEKLDELIMWLTDYPGG